MTPKELVVGRTYFDTYNGIRKCSFQEEEFSEWHSELLYTFKILNKEEIKKQEIVGGKISFSIGIDRLLYIKEAYNLDFK